MFFCDGNLFAQDDVAMELSAAGYFYNHILKIESSLKNISVKKPHFIEGPSEIYDVAYATGDINMLKDSVPNRKYLDSINMVNTEVRRNTKTNIPIHIRYHQGGHLNGPIYKMRLYKSVLYKGNTYVVIHLNDKRSGHEEIICVKFYGDEIVNYYIKSLVVDY
ncbi:hypothetical protein MgSA37_04357 [Mucilaginibacter gotjawali]|uniref:Uncharacterized protein n=1 Tax=Mucilaginibacter gotjawali TaxID=1550579 RepID=A0A0X8X5Q3_9SPHI|nr:hypothetical protein MgSA37_04357 [Mucilaginibacter gotjawali]